MAIFRTNTLFYSLPLISSLFYHPSPAHASSDPASRSPDIHDILPDYNLPKGILPNVPNSYTLSNQDGSFTVHLKHPCYVKFDDQLVYYAPVIKGKLSYGQISHVSGIQARMFFIWVSVTGLDMDTDSAIVDFHVGALSQKLPAYQFQTIYLVVSTNLVPLRLSDSMNLLSCIVLWHYASFLRKICYANLQPCSSVNVSFTLLKS